jgi:hypothetical protein
MWLPACHAIGIRRESRKYAGGIEKAVTDTVFCDGAGEVRRNWRLAVREALRLAV